MARVFSPGIRDRSLWQRQCRQTAQHPGAVLARHPGAWSDQVPGDPERQRCMLCPWPVPRIWTAGSTKRLLAVLGLKGDLKRWYRDQSYCIEIRETPRSRSESYPSAPVKWRLTDPCSELDYRLLPEHEPPAYSGRLDLQERTGDGPAWRPQAAGCARSACGPGQQPLHGGAKDGDEDPQSDPGRL